MYVVFDVSYSIYEVLFTVPFYGRVVYFISTTLLVDHLFGGDVYRRRENYVISIPQGGLMLLLECYLYLHVAFFRKPFPSLLNVKSCYKPKITTIVELLTIIRSFLLFRARHISSIFMMSTSLLTIINHGGK